MQGVIPLHCAAKYENMKLAQLCLIKGSDVNFEDQEVCHFTSHFGYWHDLAVPMSI